MVIRRGWWIGLALTFGLGLTALGVGSAQAQCAAGQPFVPGVGCGQPNRPSGSYAQPYYDPRVGQPYQPWVQPSNNPQPARGWGFCGLVATSPLDGLAHGSNTFYWNPISGVTNYRVNVFGVDVNPGALVAGFTTGGIETHVSGDLSGIPGYQLAWEVQGLVNGAVVCTSPRYTMGHAAS